MSKLPLLIEKASTATQPPPLPPEGLPRRRTPAWLRWLVLTAILPYVWLDQWARKTARKVVKSPYEMRGTCKRRGNCCHYILLSKPTDWFGRLCLWWQSDMHGFFKRSSQTIEQDGKEYLVMGCRHLQQNGSCGNHLRRPSICRNWPIIEQFEAPQVLRGCGFKVYSEGKELKHDDTPSTGKKSEESCSLRSNSLST